MRLGHIACALWCFASAGVACDTSSGGTADEAGAGDAPAASDGASPPADAAHDGGSLAPQDASHPNDASLDSDAADGSTAARDASSESATDAVADVRASDASDASTMPDAGPPVDGGVCNAVTNLGPSVAEVRVAADAPAPQGGTLVIGTYALTRWEVYTGIGGLAGPTGNTRKHTMQFGASTYEEVTADNGQGDEHFTRTWATQGTFLTSRQLCPTIDNLGDDYTATPTTLTLQASGVVFTLTRQ